MRNRARVLSLFAIATILTVYGLLYGAARQEALSSPLISAIKEGDEGTVSFLLEQGASPDTYESEVTITMWLQLCASRLRSQPAEYLPRQALFVAVEDGIPKQRAIVERLLKAGASVNIRNQDGRTPLMQATFRDDASLIWTLRRFGADPDQRDRFGNTAIDLATHNNKRNSVAGLF